MAVKNNPVLGYVECDGCAGRASVHQTTRGAGRYLYTRCSACGVDQRTGAAVQSRLWWGCRWLDGVPETRPPGVTDEPESGPESGPKSGPEPGHEPGNEPKASGGSGWLWAGLGAVALGIAAMMR